MVKLLNRLAPTLTSVSSYVLFSSIVTIWGGRRFKS